MWQNKIDRGNQRDNTHSPMNLRVMCKCRFVLMNLVALPCILLLTGCHETKPNAQSTQVLRINLPSAPPSFDPRCGRDSTTNAVCNLFFEGLTRATKESMQAPAIAESIDISPDKKTYTFHLKKARWSDGSPLTASDFAHSWKKILDPSFPSPNADLLYSIKNAQEAKLGKVPLDAVGIKVLDDYTLVVELKAPTPYFLQLTAYHTYFPTSYKVVEQYPDWATAGNSQHYVTNGPYRLKQYTVNDKIILEKNPYYWDAEHVKLDEIRIFLVTNENTVFDMFDKHELDLIGGPFTDVPIDYLPHLYKKREHCFIQDTAMTMSLIFNTQRFPFINKNIRKAFAYALNRRELAEAIFQSSDVTPGYDGIPPLLKRGMSSNFFRDEDIGKAREFFNQGLQELGITRKEFPSLTFLYSNNKPVRYKIAQILQENWMKHLDVVVGLETLDWQVYLNKLFNKDYQFGLSSWYYDIFEPINSLERYKYRREGKNYAAWENETYISLLDAAVTEPNEEVRWQLLEKAEAVLMSEVPTAPLFHGKSIVLMQPNVKNVYVSPTDRLNLTYAYLEE